jgi:ABC-type transport system substrate-binding protein
VNGRSVDAKDVVATWERWKEQGNYRNELVNAVDPNAPIVSMSSPDNSTLVIKLAQPNSATLGLLTQNRAGNFFVIPKEALDESSIDLRTQDVGSGPWMVKEWRSGFGIVWEKNPNFQHDPIANIPYMGEVRNPTILEVAVGVAQFRAGQIYSYTIPGEEILLTKKEIPDLLMIPSAGVAADSHRFIMSHKPDQPWLDERVRQAWVHTLDRDLLIEVQGGISEYEAEGIPIETRWDSALPADTFVGWQLDPRSKEFGPNGKYYSYDLAEAKKLLSAAGFPDGMDTVLHYPQRGYPSRVFNLFETVYNHVLSSGIFRFEIDRVNYDLDWTPKFRNAKGMIDDIALLFESGSADPSVRMFSKFHSTGALYNGGDSTLDDILVKTLDEFDAERRKALVLDAQRHEGKTQHAPMTHGGYSSYSLLWPIVRNAGVYSGGGMRPDCFEYIDPAYAPGA